MTTHCAVFLSPPRAGEVKTRLASDIGEPHALRLYRLMAARVLAAVTAAGLHPTVWYAPADAGPEMSRWLGESVDLRLQASGDLASRLAAAARSAVEGERWLGLAPDCPALEPVHLEEAVGRLAQWPVVLGPAMNGACYLIGGTAPLPDLWNGIAWGGDQVLDQLRRRLVTLGLPWSELPVLRIVDTAADARAAGLLT